MNKTQALYRKAKRLIPGGTQLLSKRPEMFLPDLWPAYYSKAKGCEIWDLDGNKYIDMSYMGIGCCILGYADKDVNLAIEKVIAKGSMSTLNAPEEVSLAKELIKLHPWADMVRYARCGGEAMSIAVRIARAVTGRDVVLFCGYHGWSDWYLSANLSGDKSLDGHLLPGLEPKGVPRGLMGTAIPFGYNDRDGFLKLVRAYNNKIGAIVLEPVRDKYPKPGFIKAINNAVKDLKAVLVVDEITAGFRLNLGGGHLLFNLKPDIAVFAKGMSNGYAMAAIIGKRRVMETAQETFISSTYWTERVGPVAALATLKKLRAHKVIRHLNVIGKKVQEGWKKLADKNIIRIEISGIYPLGHFSFLHNEPVVLKTLFTQQMLEKGFLASTVFYASYAHKNIQINKYLVAADDSFAFIKKAIASGEPQKYLKGPVCHSGFKRLV